PGHDLLPGSVGAQREVGAIGQITHVGEPFGYNRHALVLTEAGQANRVATVGRFHPIEIGFPGRTADGYETTRADGISGSILVHTMGEFEPSCLMWGHSWGPRETL